MAEHGLSPLAVVLSATFWTTLWGPIGLVLATPLTICLVVLGRHVESLKFLDVMFGDRPALSPPEIFYQRMLAEDPAEALDKAEEFLQEKPLAAYYDEVALKGLKLAQIDLDREALDTLHLQRVRDSVIELVKEFDDHDDQITEAEPAQDAERQRPSIPFVMRSPWTSRCWRGTNSRRIGKAKPRFFASPGGLAWMRLPRRCSHNCCRSTASPPGSRARMHSRPRISFACKRKVSR